MKRQIASGLVGLMALCSVNLVHAEPRAPNEKVKIQHQQNLENDLVNLIRDNANKFDFDMDGDVVVGRHEYTTDNTRMLGRKGSYLVSFEIRYGVHEQKAVQQRQMPMIEDPYAEETAEDEDVAVQQYKISEVFIVVKDLDRDITERIEIDIGEKTDSIGRHHDRIIGESVSYFGNLPDELWD
jgi:hypothetical protein